MIKQFDFKNPDYRPIFAERLERLARIRKHPEMLPDLNAYYRDNPAQFIDDWGVTFDPRNTSKGIPSTVPFVLFDRQREFIEYVIRKWKNGEDGLVEKSRDMGISWTAMALATTLCMFNQGIVIGFGSRKEEYVDTRNSPKSLFWKGREFVKHVPVEFRGTWTEADAPFMRIGFPDTGSFITGEAGDGIGRGDRTSIYFIDESAFLERPELIDYSLSATTNCRIDMSSVHGSNNPFAEKRHSGRVEVFVFDWRDDPRKDQEWYDEQVAKLPPMVVAQEIDRDYAASVEGLIPPEWIRAAIDAHVRLGFHPTGARTASLDVADTGSDFNGFCGVHGVVIEHLEQWSGKGSDIFATTQKALDLCDSKKYVSLTYDGDGLGAGVRGDARIINEGRVAAKRTPIRVMAHRGSAEVFDPKGEDVKGVKNEDYFLNRKAQAWWALRSRFEKTYQAVVQKKPISRDEIISISSSCPEYRTLVTELSQPTYSTTGSGKITIDKAPDGLKSPNLADAVCIKFSKATRQPVVISSEAISRFGGRRR